MSTHSSSGRLVRRLSWTIAAVVASSALLLALIGLFLAAGTITRSYEARLRAMGEVAAAGIDGATFATFASDGDATRTEWRALSKTLAQVRESQGLLYAYTVRLNQNNLPALVVDGSEEPEPFGTEYDERPELKQMYDQGKTVLTPIIRDEYGQYRTVYSPIRDRGGKVVGAVGLDLPERSVLESLADMTFAFAGALVGVLLVGLFIGRRAAGRIAARVMPMAHAARAYAGGDLTVAVAQGRPVRKPDEVDELQGSLIAMQQNLTGLVVELRESAAHVVAATSGLSGAVATVSSVAGEASEAMSQVSSGTAEQAANATELAGFFEQFSEGLAALAAAADDQARLVARAAEEAGEIARVTEQVVLAATEAARAAGETTGVARTGRTAVTEAARAVDEIATVVTQATAGMEQLNSRAGQIGTISTTIRDLAEQSSLLALNAAIEAARAGEHGRGFAVVADEVRKLAGRSAQSADQITTILESIQGEVQATLGKLQTGQVALRTGGELASKAQAALVEIEQSAERTRGRIDEVAADSARTAEQARQIGAMARQAADQVLASTAGAREVAAGGGRARSAVQSVAAISEETAALTGTTQELMGRVTASARQVQGAVESLTRLARELEQATARFRV